MKLNKLAVHHLLFLRYLPAIFLFFSLSLIADPYPPTWNSSTGSAIHYQPVAWPSEPQSPLDCGTQCGEWKPYTRFQNEIADARTRDQSNGGTSPQSYVNVASSCLDQTLPSVYYYLHKGNTQDDDVLMFRWRVESAAHNYATGKNAGNFSSGNPWSSALWTVFFDLDGTGYKSLAAHLDGSIGSPSESIDRLAGIWGNASNHSLDYENDPNIHLLGHNPTAFIGDNGKILNFSNNLTPTESWTNGADETQWDYGTTRAQLISKNSCTEYFVDYQIPLAMLDASDVGGPSITRDTPISMMFCTANSLNNPLQKDCAIGKEWLADPNVTAPFGDYLSFSQPEPYSQPIISSVEVIPPNSCPGTYQLNTTVQDTLALQDGVVISSVQTVDFYYWYDVNGDGEATSSDVGSQWVQISSNTTLDANTLNSWSASWDASGLPKGKYLIGVQALDDNSKVDDGVAPSGVNNRTFSYLAGNIENKIYNSNNWLPDQESEFPSHSPIRSTSLTEDWYGNPTITGQQIALIGTAINACGLAPTIELTSNTNNIPVGGTITNTIAISNPANNTEDITVTSISDVLPEGFSYVTNTTSGVTLSEPTFNGQTSTWTFNTPLTISSGSSSNLFFDMLAPAIPGTYNNNASAETSFGSLVSDPVAISVDSVRLSVSNIPDRYSVAADGSEQITFTINYANDSFVPVSNASLITTLPTGTNYINCTNGTSCGLSGSDVFWTIGSIEAGGAGSVSYTVTIANSWSSASYTSSVPLSAIGPDGSTITETASTTVAVTGIAATGRAAMSLSQTADAIQAAPGSNITYTLNYANDGSASADNVEIVDTLPDGMTFVSCSNNCSEINDIVTWPIGTVSSSAMGTVSLTATIADPFTQQNPAINNATINWTDGIQIESKLDIGITGSMCNAYYFSNTSGDVGNAGTQKLANTYPVPTASDAGTSVTVIAPSSSNGFIEAIRFYQGAANTQDILFDGGQLSSTIYVDRKSGNGINLRTSVYDYNSIDGSLLLLGQETVTFKGSQTGALTTNFSPTGTLKKDHRLLWVYEAQSTHNQNTLEAQFQFGGSVVNAISGGTSAALSGSSFCVTPPASLVISKVVDDVNISAGTTPTLTYTTSYANTGEVAATNVLLVDSLPSGFTSCEYSIDNNNWAGCSADNTHSYSIGTISAGDSGKFYLRGVASEGSSDGDSFTSIVVISSDQTSEVNATARTNVTGASSSGVAELSLSLFSDKSSIFPSDTVTYTVTATNIGGASANNVVINNVLPTASYYNFNSCSDSCTNNAGTISWDLGTIAAGSSQSFSYSMLASTTSLAAGITTITDDVTVTADILSPVISNAVTVNISGNPSLSLSNNVTPSSGLAPNDTVTYTLVVTNNGSSTAKDVVIKNPIPNALSYTGNITSSVGTASFDTINNQVINDIGDLVSGSSSTLTFTAKISNHLDSGDSSITNTATVSGSNALNKSASSVIVATASAQLSILHNQSGSTAYPAANLTADVSNSATIFVDQSDQFSLGQLIKINATTAKIISISDSNIVLNNPVTATSGSHIIGAITLSITYQNTGNAVAENVDITEALPNQLNYYSASPLADSAPVTGSSGNLNWHIGDLATGESGNLKVIVFPSGEMGAFTSTATIDADNAASDSASVITTIGGVSVKKTTSTPMAIAGGFATYSIKLTNSLSTDITNVIVTDTLSDGFAYQPSSAEVDNISTEPTISVSDNNSTQPQWNGLTIPANDSVTITFNADISSDAGARTYQNEVLVEADSGIGIQAFDPLSTRAEDVTVIGEGTGVLTGYIFSRDDASGDTYVTGSDIPFNAVEVRIHKAEDDCSDLYSTTCYITYTNSDGYFSVVAPAESWIVSIQKGTGELPLSWTQVVGENEAEVIIPNQSVIEEHNGFAYRLSYTVTAQANSGGSVSPETTTVIEGTSTSFTVTPDSGYSIDSVSGCNGSLSGSTYITGAINSDCTVTASFILNKYDVTPVAGSGGSLSPNTVQSVNYGATTSFIVTPDSSYSIDSVTGCNGGLSGSTYTTGTITSACSVTASFSYIPNTHNVTPVSGNGGSLSPGTVQNINSGSATSFTVTPDSGYTIDNVTGCNGNLSGSTYTTGSITSDCSVSASFSSTPDIHNVTPIAGNGGSLSPSTVQSVSSGTATSFTVTPDSGYNVSSVTGCSGSLSGSTYTTNAITSSCTVTANFAESITTNSPPVAVDDDYSVSEWNVISLSVLTNDSDPNDDIISILSAEATIGSVEISNNQIEYQPVTGQTGNVEIKYVITDPDGETAQATVELTFDVSESALSPAITVPENLCGPLSVNANALYTKVDLPMASATDRFGNTLPVSLVDNATWFPPGINTIYWTASDSEGRTSIAPQKICVTPLVSLRKDQTVLEGESVNVSVYLNGESEVYPLSIPYTVGGTAQFAQDHSLADGVVVIESGTEANIQLEILQDTISDGGETIEVSLDESLNIGNKYTHVVTISEDNIAPKLTLSASQQDQKRLSVTKTGGVITIESQVYDPNIGDTFSYDWSSSDSQIINQSTDTTTFQFDPLNLALGIYHIELTVSDSGSPAKSVYEKIYIQVFEQLEVLTSADSDGDLIPDNVENYQDLDGDGIPDYLDRIDECNVLPELSTVQDGYLVEGSPGVCLRRGDYTLNGETGGVLITDSDVESGRATQSDTEATNIGGIYDFIAYDLPDNKQTFSIVMPLRNPIPINPVYRKFREGSGWGFFIEDGSNLIKSTKGDPGYCPPPGGSIWVAGMNEGDWCIQLTIEDGGPNDDDGQINGTIVDPGYVGVMLNSNNVPVAVDDTAIFDLNKALNIDVLSNDSDEDEDNITITSANASLGTVSIINNTVQYLPPTDFIGTDEIQYGISDGNGGTHSAKVMITIVVNQPPVAIDDSVSIEQGTSIVISPLNNDSDPFDDVISLFSVSSSNNSIVINDDGTLSYTPESNFYGEESITYVIEDSAGNQAEATLHILVIQSSHQVTAETKSGGTSSIKLLLFLILLTLMRLTGFRLNIRRKDIA